MMSAIAKNGAIIAARAVRMEPPSSAVAMTGFARPPVPVSERPRARTVVACTIPATPPPATTARLHFRNGLTSVTMDAVTTVPATTAAGVATVSRKLSIQGT